MGGLVVTLVALFGRTDSRSVSDGNHIEDKQREKAHGVERHGRVWRDGSNESNVGGEI